MNKTEPNPDAEVLWTLTEKEQSQLAAVALLQKMGFQYLTPEEALALRGGRTSRILLEDILRSRLQQINAIQFKGRTHSFTGANIRRGIQALADVPLAEGYQNAGRLVYDLLRLGKSLEQTIEGDTKSFTLRYIDWDNWQNNVFHVTTEFTVQRAGSQKNCRPDIVLFINGIPCGVIECKAPTVDLAEAVTDLLAYQSAEYVPELFKYIQIVIAVNTQEAKYATAGTEAKFWAVWQTRGEDGAEIEHLLQTPLPEAARESLLSGFVRERPQFYAIEQAGRLVTEQDRTVYALCRPERLLSLCREFILYDGGVKKIARYQQYYAVEEAMDRLLHPDKSGSRPGGLIWHTQGSGKSLTMVMLANAIALSAQIENPRIILVTDRVDLDRQIRDTFSRCGLEPHQAGSGADLRRLIESGRASVITTLIHKFDTALSKGEFAEDSPDIFVLVDEGHRTQGGAFQAKMRLVFPRACYIAFTGTPLLKSEKSTIARFGGLIDTYPMDQAVADHAVVPLLYERRHVEQEVNQQPIDTWFERICQGLTEDQKRDLKRKYSRSEALSKTEQRLKTIAYDVSEHYRTNWQQDGYYKAQLVAPDKKSAILLHRFLNEVGHVTSNVVISAPDEREGDGDDDAGAETIVKHFWQSILAKYGTEERYNDAIISSFKGAEGPEILIVVDKLITGFDVPRNTVLYLARRLAHHTLLQAIARVNRLYEDKDFGYIIDYMGILGELDRALTEYKALAGYDPKDVEGVLHDIREQLDLLPQRHAALLDVFKTICNKNDVEEYERFLADEVVRAEFYSVLNEFARCLRIALSTEVFYEETSAQTITRYKNDLLRFQKLRASVQQRYAEVVDMKSLEPQIAKLLDTYVSSDTVEILTPEPINIFDAAAMERAVEGLGTPAAQADTIASAMARTLTERRDEDPVLYRKFSEMLRDTIQAFRDQLLSELEYLQKIRDLRNQVVTNAGENIPAQLKNNAVAQAYYRLVLEKQQEIIKDPGDTNVAADIALMIDQAIGDEIVVDWRLKEDIKKRMRANIDDGFFEFAQAGRINLDWNALDDLASEAARVAQSRLP
jgi:type I restriction enzyme R subunit